MDPTATAATRAATYTVEVLTGLVRHNVDVLPLTLREREIAIAIAVAKTPIATDSLCEQLYPDRDVEQAKSMVKVYVHRLRRHVAADFIVFRDGGYAMGPAARSDLPNAEAWLKRLAWGPYLTPAEAERIRGVAAALRREPPAALLRFEWYATLTRRLQRVGHDLAMALAAKAAGLGMILEGIEIARELTYEDQCDEEAWEFIIRHRIAIGERCAARQGFRFYEAALEKELQMKPSRSLVELAAGGE